VVTAGKQMVMKWVLLLLPFLMLNLEAQPVDRQHLREDFLQAAARKSALDSFKCSLEKIKTKTPVEECYYGICFALNTQYAPGTWAKIKLVTQSRTLLNDAISRDQIDPELRFLRLTLEHFLPSFLGMSKDIPGDLAAILGQPHFVEDNPALRKKALEFLLSTNRCSAEQTRQVHQQLQELNKKEIAVLGKIL
jgi:hypothetical protein